MVETYGVSTLCTFVEIFECCGCCCFCHWQLITVTDSLYVLKWRKKIFFLLFLSNDTNHELPGECQMLAATANVMNRRRTVGRIKNVCNFYRPPGLLNIVNHHLKLKRSVDKYFTGFSVFSSKYPVVWMSFTYYTLLRTYF